MSTNITIPQAFYSNRLEVLYQQLKSELFTNSNPFTRRMIIVSSPAVKSWLHLQMAQDPQLGVAAGIDIGFIDPSLHRLSLMLAIDSSNKIEASIHEPSEIDISLALEQEITRIIIEFENLLSQEQKVWEPLLSYLKISAPNLVLSKRTCKRVTALSIKLARYFIDYGTCGGKILDKWNATPVVDWQQALWIRLEVLFDKWNYPYRKFEEFAIENIPEASELQVHVFGLSYLAPLQHRFLMKIGQHIPLSYYLISPCQKFWSDLISDRESVRLKAYWLKRGVAEGQKLDLEKYLRDNNPLLANFGKLGRVMAQQMEESHLISDEKYALPNTLLECESYCDLLDEEPFIYESFHAFTLLEAVQADIALLRNPDESAKIDFETYDGTIQIHAAPKPMREVEAIYNAIVKILDTHQHDEFPILSCDVIVMAPDIAEYSPYIRSVFGVKDSVVDYQIMDLEMAAQNNFVQAFLHLLYLPLCRWDATSLLRMFEYPPFQERHKLSWDDVQTLRKWIKAAGIRWGTDQHHRNELLKKDHCSREMFEGSGDGTWNYGLGRLLEGLAMVSETSSAVYNDGTYLPIEKVESTQGDLLGKIILILRSLLEDLRPLNDGTQLTVKEWALYLRCLCDSYLAVGVREDDISGYQELVTQIAVFEKIALPLQDTTFTFHSIQSRLELILNKKSVNHRESHLQAVRFCSLLPMRSIPAKVIVLLGMHDGVFPRQDDQAKLNCLFNNADAEYYPTQIDFDRYLFLEALLSARSYLLFSYVSQAKNDTKEQAPALLVTEFLTYLDKAYRLSSGSISEKCIIKHALMPFDKRYFDETYAYKSYIRSHYIAALSHYKEEKQRPHQFISTFNTSLVPAKSFASTDFLIELNELLAFARNPLKIYFNNSLGIFLDKEEERVMPCEEEWQLSHLNAAIISREALFSNIPEVLVLAEKVGRLPSGPFKGVGVDKIKKEVEILTANLHTHEVGVRDVFAIEFNERYVVPRCEGKCWELPPLTLVTPQGINVKLVGRLENVSRQGLVTFGEDSLKDAVKMWPALLVFCNLIKKHELPIVSSLLFIKGKTGKAREANFDEPEGVLGRYIDYFFEGKRGPSPLLPEWLTPILGGNHNDLQAIINKNSNDLFQPIYDDYLKWMGRNATHLDAAAIVENWQDKARGIFVDLCTAWYPKSLKI